MKIRIPESLDDFINEGIEYTPIHPKCKSKIERKLMSINDLRVGDTYMIARGTKESWQDGWKYTDQLKENNVDVFKFVSTNELYDVKELKIPADDIDTMIFNRKIAKQKE